MTEPTSTDENPMPEQDDEQRDEIIEPEDDGPAVTGLEHQEPGHDPVTARNPDPAAASEHERNARLAEQYGL